MVTQVATVRPSDLDGAARAMREAAAAGHRVGISGAGTAANWGGQLAEVDLTVDTTGLDRLIDHRPDDLTVAVQAGLPLRTLRDVLAGHGQRVAYDAARVPAGATVGGLIATADAGPARLAYGSLRDLVIGMTVVRADGVVARSGGHVIKNVAGYDLAKLFHGSLGAFGLVAEVVLRLHPLPAATGTLAVGCDAAGGFELAGRLLGAALEPVAAEWHDGRLLARFEGTPRGLAARGRAARRIAGGRAEWSAAGGDGPAAAGGDGPVGDDHGRWDALAAVTAGSPGDTVLRVTTRPSRGPWLAGRVAELAADHPAGVTFTSSPAAGIHHVRIRGGEVADHAALLHALRAGVAATGGAATGGAVTVCRWAPGLPALAGAWGEPPPAVGVLRAVKRAFDPDGRLGPGRFAPWF
jgi:glycolate oxidase FAD binding subunit